MTRRQVKKKHQNMHLYESKNKLSAFSFTCLCQTICSCYRMVPSAIWEIFSECLIFCNLFHEPLGFKAFTLSLNACLNVSRVILLTNCIGFA